MRETSCKIVMFATVLVLIFALGAVYGFNGFGERGGGKGDGRREQSGGKPGGPPVHQQPAINTHGSGHPSTPAGGGYSKPTVSDHKQPPKLDAVKPQMNHRSGEGYSKPVLSVEKPLPKPEGVKPHQDMKPLKQQNNPADQGHFRPPQRGDTPSLQPERSGQGAHTKPGGQGMPMHGIQPQPGQGQKDRPTPGQVQDFLKLPKTDAGRSGPGIGKIGAGAVGVAAGAVALDHFVNRDKQRHPSEDPGMAYHPVRGPHRQDTLQHDARQIRDTYGNRYQQVFNQTWMIDHPNLKPFPWHNHVWPGHPWNYWWRPATWVVLSSWIPWQWGTAVYYDYGNNFYYDNGFVILNGQRLCTADEYYRQAVKIVSSLPNVNDDPNQWMPLGVFALKPAAGEASDMILQLAVNKDGILQGTYYNASNDTAKPIRGIVEKKSQRAVWTFADDQNHSVILETGVYNLTQDQTEVLVHFGKHRTEQWLLVRLQEPQA